MTTGERIKKIRKSLNLNQTEFGKRINLSQTTIGTFENNTRRLTDRVIQDIWREYNINPDWLLNGNEPMYQDVISNLDINDEVKQLAKQYSLLNDKDRELVKNMINSLSEKIEMRP